MTLDLERLEALARAAGAETWSDGDLDGYVFGADGDSVCVCHPNIGAMPEAIYPEHRSGYIAAANPAAMLELLALLKAQAAGIERYGVLMKRATDQVAGLLNERNQLITERNNALQRAIKAEYRPSVVRTRAGDHAVQMLPLNLPASLDLNDSEGGATD